MASCISSGCFNFGVLMTRPGGSPPSTCKYSLLRERLALPEDNPFDVALLPESARSALHTAPTLLLLSVPVRLLRFFQEDFTSLADFLDQLLRFCPACLCRATGGFTALFGGELLCTRPPPTPTKFNCSRVLSWHSLILSMCNAWRARAPRNYRKEWK